MGLLFEEKVEELYGEELRNMDNSNEECNNYTSGEKKELSIEEEISLELSELKAKNTSGNGNETKKKETIHFIDLNCECVIFCKTRKPLVPEIFVKKVIQDLANPSHMEKRTRYIQKLTPITSSCSSSMDQLIKLSQRVLAPHFHDENSDKAYKFAVEVTRRNFNALERLDIIKQVVSQVIQEGKYKHQVNLKDYDKLILIECFKNNIGMCVVDSDYSKKYKKYNVQQIYEVKMKEQDAKVL